MIPIPKLYALVSFCKLIKHIDLVIENKKLPIGSKILQMGRVSDILCKRGSFTAEAFFPQT